MASDRLNILDALGMVRVESKQQAPLLQAFGLRWSVANGLDYLTLDEALSTNALDVAEVNAGGRVSAVKVANASDKMVFLMVGEVLVGCKQDRVLNTSVMVPAKSEMSIPVACVEAGRWRYRTQKFQSGQFCSYGDLRKVLCTGATAQYRTMGAPGSDQGAVWTEISRKMQKMGFTSQTSALKEMFDDYTAKLDQLGDSFSAPEGCHGAAFVTQDKILGADLFDKPSTLGKLWTKLVKSYSFDVLGGSHSAQHSLGPDSVAEWLKSAIAAKVDSFDSPGVGQDARIESESLEGAALLVQETPVHVQLFSKVPH